jgi:hypothetical protein
MQYTVETEIGEREHFKLTLASLDDEEQLVLEINPAQLETSHKISITPYKLAGANMEAQPVAFSGREQIPLKFDFVLSATETGQLKPDGSVGRQPLEELKVHRVLQTIETWAKQLAPGKNRTRRFAVVTGETSFIGQIDQLTIRRNQINDRGYTLAAEVSLSFVEVSEYEF